MRKIEVEQVITRKMKPKKGHKTGPTVTSTIEKNLIFFQRKTYFQTYFSKNN